MKKIISVLICLGLLGMSACSNETTITKTSDENATTITTASNQDDVEVLDDDSMNALGDIQVDEGLVTVTVTIPADLMGETTQEKVDESVSEQGYISGTLNSDGSVTYVMTKAKHKEAMKQMAEGFDKNLQEIVDSEDSPNIISITHNDDFTDFKVEYAADELSFVDSFTVITFYYMGGFYGIFNGKTPDNIHVSFVNSKTGKVIQEANSKDIATESSNTDT